MDIIINHSMFIKQRIKQQKIIPRRVYSYNTSGLNFRSEKKAVGEEGKNLVEIVSVKDNHLYGIQSTDVISIGLV